MDIKSSLIYNGKVANDSYAAKANTAVSKENKLATGQKVAESSSDAASLQIKSKASESALENVNAASSTVSDVAKAEEMIREANRRILAKSDDSVLAQSNQSTETVTKLLG